MNYYHNTSEIHKQTFAFIEIEESNHIFTITLNREHKKNAIHPHMLNELAFALQYAKEEKNIWIIIFQAKGNVFCAGADLKAFMGNVGEFNSSIPSPNQEILIGELFNKVHKPIITKVTGDVYAGGFFFLAGATYVVANENITLGLPEVKRGLFPFQVMASLLRIMPPRKVLDWCIRGYNLPVQKAHDFGLITHIATSENINNIIENLIEEIQQNSPSAIKLGLEAFDHIQSAESQHQYLIKMLQQTIMTQDAQEGLLAFKQKRKPNWKGE